MDVTLRIWRSNGGKDAGRFHTYPMTGVDPSMSLLEVLDDLNDTSSGRARGSGAL